MEGAHIDGGISWQPIDDRTVCHLSSEFIEVKHGVIAILMVTSSPLYV